MSSSPIGLYVKEPPSLHDWDPNAPKVAKRVARLIHERAPWAFPEHIGSSSVPGCAGKGIIDLQIPVAPDDMQPLKDVLEDLGFQHQMGPVVWPEERPMRTGSIDHAGTRYYLHIHVIPEHEMEIEVARRFRDRLKADDSLRDEYVAFKRSILASGIADRDEYTRAKSAWIERHLADIAELERKANAKSSGQR